MVLAGVALLTGCGGGKAKPPKPGQAALLGSYDKDSAVGSGLQERLLGAASDADGDRYLLASSSLVRLSPTGKGTSLPVGSAGFNGSSPAGAAAMPDGSVLFGHGSEVIRLDPKSGTTQVLAGDLDRSRALDAPAPAGATSGDVHFTTAVAPLGVTRDGTVMIADGRALWALASGHLTRVYQRPLMHGKDTTLNSAGTTVAPDGTTYLRQPYAESATLATIQVISPQGKVSSLSLPATISGVTGPPATLFPYWLASDGAGGLYIRAARVDTGQYGDYVLHVHDGTATVVVSATSAAGAAKTSSCSVPHPTDATRFPCALPTSLTYHAGELVLAGEQSYVVTVQVS